jgi:HSP20 family protein
MKTELPDTGHRFDTPLIGRLEEETVILERVTKTYDSVRRRAYELFEARGRADGKVLDDWFRAEEELLGRLPLTLAETERHLTVHAEVHGFAARNIEVWVEPRRIVLKGHTRDAGGEKTSTRHHNERSTKEFLRALELPTTIHPGQLTATVEDGVLRIILVKLDRSPVGAREILAA